MVYAERVQEVRGNYDIYKVNLETKEIKEDYTKNSNKVAYLSNAQKL